MTLRVALWGGASLNNVGDQLLMDVAETELRRRAPGCEVVRFCPWSDGPPVEPLWIDADGRWSGSGSFDAIVGLGGIWAGPPFRATFMQVFTFGADPAGFDPGTFTAWHGVGLADGAAPLTRASWREYIQALVGRMDHLSVRGHDAATRFASAVDIAPPVVADPAFALAPAPARRRSVARPRIGIAIGDARESAQLTRFLTHPRFRERWCRWNPATCFSLDEVLARETDQAELARKAGFLDKVWPNLTALTRYADVEFLGIANMYADDEVARRGVAAVEGATLRELGAVDAEQISRVMSEYDAVVVSRFHSVVLALRTGIPFVALDPYWTPRTGTSKVHELLADVQLPHRRVDADTDLAALLGDVLTADGPEPAAYRRMHERAQCDFDGLADRISAAS